MPAAYPGLDQDAWHEEARAIILHGRLWVDESIGKPGNWAYVINPRDGHYYSKFGLLNGLMHVPALALELAATGKLPPESNAAGPNPARVRIIDLMFAWLSVGIALLLWSVSGYYIESLWKRALLVLMTLYGTSLWYYLRFPSSEAAQVGLFLLFWLCLLRFSRHEKPLAARPRRDALWAWFALFLLCQTRVVDLFIVPLFGVYLSWLAWRSELTSSERFRFVLTAVVLPAALIALLQGLVHFIKFGSPFLSGYHQYVETPNPHSVWQVLWEFAFHPQWSFFVTFPVLILALPGWWLYLRRHRAEAVFLLGLLYGMFVIVAPLPFWRGESTYGPRYFLYLLPVLSLPALYVLACIRGAWTVPVVVVALFVACAQFQVQRVGFFVWRGTLDKLAGDNPEVQSYFNYNSVPKICWDHLRYRNHPEGLPYYPAMARGKTPEKLATWKRDLLDCISFSNLYWFPELNR